jgi:hypothetical protein
MVGKTRRIGLAVLAVLAFSGCHTAFGPDPLDRTWRAHEGERVTFFVRPGSFAEQNVARLTEVLEDQYTATVNALRLTYAGRLHAYAYNSAAEANFQFTYSGRAYPETESFRFVAVPPVGDSLFGLMSHEANHVLIINGLGRAGTYFMTEGLATAVMSETFHRAGRHFYYQWTRSNRSLVLPVARLVDDGGWNNVSTEISYRVSASFLMFLLDTYGADPLRQIYGASSKEFADRVRAAYGKTLESLEADWLRFTDSYVG